MVQRCRHRGGRSLPPGSGQGQDAAVLQGARQVPGARRARLCVQHAPGDGQRVQVPGDCLCAEDGDALRERRVQAPRHRARRPGWPDAVPEAPGGAFLPPGVHRRLPGEHVHLGEVRRHLRRHQDGPPLRLRLGDGDGHLPQQGEQRPGLPRVRLPVHGRCLRGEPPRSGAPAEPQRARGRAVHLRAAQQREPRAPGGGPRRPPRRRVPRQAQV